MSNCNLDRDQANSDGSISVLNPHYPAAEDVLESFRRFHIRTAEQLKASWERSESLRPNAEERQAMAEVKARALGINNLTLYQEEMRVVKKRYIDRILPLLRKRGNKSAVGLPVRDEPGAPSAKDESFWWASTHAYDHLDTLDYGASRPANVPVFESGGVRLAGDFGIVHNSDDLHNASCGAEGLFGLNWARTPRGGVFGLWVSSPLIELSGSVTGSSDDDSVGWLISGDSWCKCYMHLKQTIFQLEIGPSHPGERILAESQEQKRLFSSENSGKELSFNFPLLLAMPVVVIDTALVHPETLFCRLEVRFDVQMEGVAVFEKNIFLRFRQWPMTVV